VPAISQLRDADGRLVLALEKADVSRLVAAGWKPPVPITVKARDGVTDLYGLMYQPTNLDPAKKYPIVNHIYPGPQTGSVGGRTFSPSRGDAQALAELGFVVVEIDGMGTPWRSKKFHEAYYGNMGDNTLPDQVAAMQELARRYAWIDIDRAGIYGHSGGGYATADAMFRYPDFFKVGISEAGNHDNRVYEDDWAEKWQGLLERRTDGTTNYDNQANQLIAKNLKGKLLLAHGTMDANVREQYAAGGQRAPKLAAGRAGGRKEANRSSGAPWAVRRPAGRSPARVPDARRRTPRAGANATATIAGGTKSMTIAARTAPMIVDAPSSGQSRIAASV
jgi:dienelactone hydrolase